MNIGGKNIQPILLYLPDDQMWVDRWEAGKKHFAEAGIHDMIHVAGVHGQKFGIIGTHCYELDKPNGGHMIGQKYTASFLSMYVMYNVANVLPNDYFLFLEDDTRFNSDWIERTQEALYHIPETFDFLFLGSCCTEGKPRKHISSGLYEFPGNKGPFPQHVYPLGGNAYIVAKKALPYIIATQRDAYAPADINLALHSFPNLRVFAILPRVCEQLNNEHLPV